MVVALPLLGAGMGAAASVAGSGPAAPLCAQAASLHRVGIVVEHGDGQVIRRCVGFDTATATALAVLQASGLEVGISSYGGGLGAAVCQIDNEPSTYPPGCFTASGSYWVLFVSRAGGAWATGGSRRIERDGRRRRRHRLPVRPADRRGPTARVSGRHVPGIDAAAGADARGLGSADRCSARILRYTLGTCTALRPHTSKRNPHHGGARGCHTGARARVRSDR